MLYFTAVLNIQRYFSLFLDFDKAFNTLFTTTMFFGNKILEIMFCVKFKIKIKHSYKSLSTNKSVSENLQNSLK